jgi:hypothetical protein
MYTVEVVSVEFPGLRRDFQGECHLGDNVMGDAPMRAQDICHITLLFEAMRHISLVFPNPEPAATT